jgi:hypothetical protein
MLKTPDLLPVPRQRCPRQDIVRCPGTVVRVGCQYKNYGLKGHPDLHKPSDGEQPSSTITKGSKTQRHLNLRDLHTSE